MSENFGTVLIVDDDPLVGESLRLALKRAGIGAVYTASPTEADLALGESTFDLVISDVFMPGNNRLEWIEHLLTRATVPAIILMTGTPNLETACRAANLPVEGYLLKPIGQAEFIGKVTAVLRSRRDTVEFQRLAGEILALLAARPSGSNPEERTLLERLVQLASVYGLRAGTTTTPNSPSEEHWRRVIADTIAAIDKTRHSFRSRELGYHRKRLQQFLVDGKF